MSFFCYSVFKDHTVYLSANRERQSLKTKQKVTYTNPIACLHRTCRLVLLRKEVIHPHVPVGIPCYDLTPIIDPTFDGSLPYGLGHRLRVLPTLMV